MAANSLLQRELKQARPFRSPHHEAFVALLRTADLMRRHAAGVLAHSGLTPQQYNILRILRGAGEKGLPTLEIGERLIEETPGVTRLLDRLEAKGMIRRARCAKDRRQVLCTIEPAGLALLARLDDPMEKMDQHALGALSAKELRELMRLLDKIREQPRSKGE